METHHSIFQYLQSTLFYNGFSLGSDQNRLAPLALSEVYAHDKNFNVISRIKDRKISSPCYQLMASKYFKYLLTLPQGSVH